jgi:hypothetical protein
MCLRLATPIVLNLPLNETQHICQQRMPSIGPSPTRNWIRTWCSAIITEPLASCTNWWLTSIELDILIASMLAVLSLGACFVIFSLAIFNSIDVIVMHAVHKVTNPTAIEISTHS